MTTNEVYTMVTWYLGGRPIAADITNQFLTDRMRKLAVAFDFPVLHIYRGFTTVNDTQALASGDFFAIKKGWLPDPYLELTQKDLDWLDSQDSLEKGSPTHFVHSGEVIWLYPTPDAGYTVRMRGIRLPLLPADPDTQILDISLEWHMVLTKYTAADILFGLGEDQRGMTLKNEALADISTLQEVRTIERRGQIGQFAVERR